MEERRHERDQWRRPRECLPSDDPARRFDGRMLKTHLQTTLFFCAKNGLERGSFMVDNSARVQAPKQKRPESVNVVKRELLGPQKSSR